MTEMSPERREELEASLVDLDGTEPKVVSVLAADLRALLADSARLERIERQVRELAEYKEQCADAALAMPDRHNQHKRRSEGYRRQANELRAIVDTGRGEGGGV